MENMTVALFGGSFDPVTDAHKEIIANLSERFDRVVVMPTAVSPFKTTASASGAHRAEMLKRATRNMKNVTVSRYELKKQGVSYTVDTLEHLKAKYDGAKIFTVIGSEELSRLGEWKSIDRLKSLTTFFVVERSGFELTADKFAQVVKSGFDVRLAAFSASDVSSSEVKIERAFGRKNLPVPKSVAKYIEKNGLYEDYRFITDRYEEFGLKKERTEHIRRVALAAVKLAKRCGVSASDAVTAALLHDIAKETDEKQLEKMGCQVPPAAKDMPKKIRHAEYGAVIARHAFGVENEEIIEAVRQHTTGGKNMSKLSQVVFLADCIEEGRKFAQAYEVRLVARESFEKAIELSLRYEIERLKEDGAEIYPLTQEVCDSYKKLNESPKQKATQEKKKAEKKTAPKTKKEIAEQNEERDSAEKETLVSVAEETQKREISKVSDEEAHKLALEIGGYLSEKKATEVTLIDVRERTVVTDYFVIASASSTTAVRALAEYVDEKLSKGKGLEPLHRDKNPQWYAVDYGSVILHIFLKNVRLTYDLERLWSDGTNTETVE